MNFYTNVSRYGQNLLYRGYRNGSPIQQKIKFQPTLYAQSQNETDWKALDGVNVEPMKFDSMREAKQFMEMYAGVNGFNVYGNTKYISQFIQERWPDEVEFDPNLVNIVNIDIEVASDEGFPEPDQANHPIISIALKSNKDENYYVWGLGEYDTSKSIVSNVQYMHCRDEKELLEKFLLFWSKLKPDVVTGWNVRFFDVPYIINRMHRVIGEKLTKKMSPWEMVEQKSVRYKMKEMNTYEMTGISQLDYLDLFQKFGYSYGTQASYRLDHIAYVVLGERKLSYEEFGNLYTLYKEDHQKFIDYNIKDVQLVDRLEDKMGLIVLAMTIAYKAGVNYNDTFGTTGIWDTIIYRNLCQKKIAILPYAGKMKSDYPGGYVKDPQVGMHDWVCSFDLNSLYPNLIVQYNMSPETIVEDDRNFNASVSKCLSGEVVNDTDYAMAANGTYFRTDRRGVLPSIVTAYYSERVQMKNKMIEAQKKLEKSGKSYEVERDINRYENQQMAIKILLNSLYGALGNQYFRYFDMRIAEGITLSGQLSVLSAEKSINQYLNNVMKTDKDYVIAIDTDSVYLDMKDLVDKTYPNNSKEDTVKYLDKVCSQAIEPVITKSFDKLYKQMGGYENRMVMGREAIADRGVWTAKKRYILNVHNNEGVQYAEPKMKIMGIEAIKSSTPQICRDRFKEAFELIMSGTNKDIQTFIADFRKEFSSQNPEDIAFPRGVSDIKKNADPKAIYGKGTPIHVRGSLLYNHLLKQHRLNNRLGEIKNGEKIKFIYLKMPNPIRENVISFPDILPKEFDLHRFINYDMQYDKTFVEPIRLILDAVGWTVEEQSTLESFF